MKKIIVAALIAASTAAQAAPKCEYGKDTAARMRCRWERGTAPEYFAGCFDILAPLDGAEKAAKVCASEYEQHKENKAALKAAKAKGGQDGR